MLLSVPHPEFIWAYRFLKVKLSDTPKLTMVAAECSKIFDVQCMGRWGEGYLCLLKRFLFLTIRRLYSFSFYVKYVYKKGYKNFLAAFFGALILFKQYQNIYTLTKKWSSNRYVYI